MDADADRVGFHVAVSNYKHSVHFHLFGALDFAVDVVDALVDLGADLIGTQFVEFNNHAAGVRQKRSYLTLLSNSLTVVSHGNSSPK